MRRIDNKAMTTDQALETLRFLCLCAPMATTIIHFETGGGRNQSVLSAIQLVFSNIPKCFETFRACVRGANKYFLATVGVPSLHQHRLIIMKFSVTLFISCLVAQGDAWFATSVSRRDVLSIGATSFLTATPLSALALRNVDPLVI
jgi:hypothetical protein